MSPARYSNASTTRHFNKEPLTLVWKKALAFLLVGLDGALLYGTLATCTSEVPALLKSGIQVLLLLSLLLLCHTKLQ